MVLALFSFIDNGRLGLAVGNNNLLVNTTAIDNDQAGFFGDVNNTVRNFDIGASTAPNTTLSFTATNVRIESVSSTPPDPGTERNIGRYVEVEERAGSTTSYFNVTFQYEDGDVTGPDEANLSVWKHNGSWTELGTESRDASANEIQYKFSAIPDPGRPILAPMATTASDLNDIATCREITPASVPADGVVNLTADVNNSPFSTCIQVSANDVVFDGQGHTVDGDGTSSDPGVLVSSSSMLSNVTVRNVTVTDWDVGIEYDGAGGGLVSHVVVTGNDDEGINVDDSTGVDFLASNLSGNGGSGIDLFHGSSSNGTVADTVATDNGDQGFHGSQSYTFRNNTATGNDGDGFDISDDNTLRNNTVADNDGYGIEVGDNNTIVDNTATNNTEDGLWVNGHNTLRNNTAIDNDGWAFTGFLNNTAENLDIGASTAPNTMLSFAATNVRLRGVSSPPAADPSGQANIGRFIDATNTSQDAFLNVTVQYKDGDASAVNESTLSLSRYNETSNQWKAIAGSTVNTAAQAVSANLTMFSTFGVFGVSDACLNYLRSVADDDGRIDTLALLDAINDWRNNRIDRSCLFDAIDYWRTDTPV